MNIANLTPTKPPGVATMRPPKIVMNYATEKAISSVITSHNMSECVISSTTGDCCKTDKKLVFSTFSKTDRNCDSSSDGTQSNVKESKEAVLDTNCNSSSYMLHSKPCKSTHDSKEFIGFIKSGTTCKEHKQEIPDNKNVACDITMYSDLNVTPNSNSDKCILTHDSYKCSQKNQITDKDRDETESNFSMCGDLDATLEISSDKNLATPYGYSCDPIVNVYKAHNIKDTSNTIRCRLLESQDRRSVLPSQLLEHVTQVTRSKVKIDPSDVFTVPIVEDSCVQSQSNFDSINDSKTEKKCADNDYSTDDMSNIDISFLFSDVNKNSCQMHVDESEKKAKKRRRNHTQKEEADEDRETIQIKKSRPNYFLAIQVNDDTIHKNVQVIQQYMLGVNPDIQRALIPVATLHITLMVMYLHDDAHVQRAVLALQKCESRLKEFIDDPVTLEVSSIDNFRDQVIFTKTDQQYRLNKLVDIVSEVFEAEGISGEGSKEFQPHITILKLSKAPTLRKKGIKKVGKEFYKPYKESILGQQTVSGIQLCAMLKPKDKHGYYHVIHSVSCVPGGYICPKSTETKFLTLHKPDLKSPLSRSLHTEIKHWTVQFVKEMHWNFNEEKRKDS